MKKKRTTRLSRTRADALRTLGNGFGHPRLGQTVEINNQEQVPHILREIAQLERHAIAIEADVYHSMFLVCRSANRFLAPRRTRMRALVTGLLAFKAGWREARHKDDAHPKRRTAKEPGKKQSPTLPSHSTGKAQS